MLLLKMCPLFFMIAVAQGREPGAIPWKQRLFWSKSATLRRERLAGAAKPGGIAQRAAPTWPISCLQGKEPRQLKLCAVREGLAQTRLAPKLLSSGGSAGEQLRRLSVRGALRAESSRGCSPKCFLVSITMFLPCLASQLELKKQKASGAMSDALSRWVEPVCKSFDSSQHANFRCLGLLLTWLDELSLCLLA